MSEPTAPPYRTHQPPEPEAPDPEHAAIAFVSARARVVRRFVAVGSIVLGLGASASVYGLFWTHYEERGLPIPLKMVAVASLMLGLVPAFLLAPRLASAAVRLRAPHWLDEASRRYGVDEVALEELTRAMLR